MRREAGLQGLRQMLLGALLCLALPAGAADPAGDEKAAAQYRRLAARGDGEAALRLGNLLAQQRIAPARYGKAVEWYEKGCGLGSFHACHNAGVSFQHGRNGASRSDAEAARYYLIAANHALLNSMINLVSLHAEGRIVTSDHRDGLKWQYIAERAAAQCPENPACRAVIEDRKGHRARFEAQLSAADRREAKRLAGQWQPLPDPPGGAR